MPEAETQTYEIVEDNGWKNHSEIDLLKFAQLFKYDTDTSNNELTEKEIAPFNFKEVYDEEYYRREFAGFPDHFYKLIAESEPFLDKRQPNLKIDYGEFRPFKQN